VGAKRRNMPKTTKKPAKRSAVRVIKDEAQGREKKAKAAGKKANAFAKKNPWAVAGISAGIGLAVGVLAGRKSKKKKK
jgi:ElaB/YqjD/DUF883 family membrane-anchored ribosome-binding protein